MGADSTYIERAYLPQLLDQNGCVIVVTPIELPEEPELDDVIAILVEAGIAVEAE